MKKYAPTAQACGMLLLIGALLVQNLNSQPALDPEPVVDVVLKKLDDQTLEVKTTTTTVQTVEHDKAELQTELDHIPDRIATLNEQIVSLNERAVELQTMIDALK